MLLAISEVSIAFTMPFLQQTNWAECWTDWLANQPANFSSYDNSLLQEKRILPSRVSMVSPKKSFKSCLQSWDYFGVGMRSRWGHILPFNPLFYATLEFEEAFHYLALSFIFNMEELSFCLPTIGGGKEPDQNNSGHHWDQSQDCHS